MSLVQSYRMRLKRRRAKVRAWRKHFALRPVVDRTDRISPGNILLFSTFRDEYVRLPYFLKYYRDLGVSHFLMVDNDSQDGGREYLAEHSDVSLWTTKASYKKARFGVDWLNWLQGRYGHEHWSLVVDPDEFFCLSVLRYPADPGADRLAGRLAATLVRGDVAGYVSKGPDGRRTLPAGPEPHGDRRVVRSRKLHDPENDAFGNLWIQGGPRARVFFADMPKKAPALNKVPLVKWDRRYAYVSSTHMLLPRGLNQTYDTLGGEKTSGVLLHAKFLDTFAAKAEEELQRKQHYAASVEYQSYYDNLQDNPDLWCKWSEKYINWRQLEILGLMSKGNWA